VVTVGKEVGRGHGLILKRKEEQGRGKYQNKRQYETKYRGDEEKVSTVWNNKTKRLRACAMADKTVLS
jgi:hypothetical protein